MTGKDIQALHDRLEQYEALLGVDRSTVGRIRDAFGIEPLHAQMLGMFFAREFVTRDGLYTVLYEGRPESEWPNEKMLDVQLSKLRKALKEGGHDIIIQTKFGEGWWMEAGEKAKLRAVIGGEKESIGKVLADLRWRNVSAEERSAIARQLNEARWGKYKKNLSVRTDEKIFA
jgi:hypothetical protein